MTYVPDLNTFLSRVVNENPDILKGIIFKSTAHTGLLISGEQEYRLEFMGDSLFRIHFNKGETSREDRKWSIHKTASSLRITGIRFSYSKLKGGVVITLGAVCRSRRLLHAD